jgi:hypothetical protein
MQELIEATISTADGIADCRLDLLQESEGIYAAVILYPHTEDGRQVSKVYEHRLVHDSGVYRFEESDMVHPKVLAMEQQLSDTILNA